MRILIITPENADKIPYDDYLHSDLIIRITLEGTYEVIKNRYGRNLVGKYNELLNLSGEQR